MKFVFLYVACFTYRNGLWVLQFVSNFRNHFFRKAEFHVFMWCIYVHVYKHIVFVYLTISVSIHLLRDWLLWNQQQWTWECSKSFETAILFFGDLSRSHIARMYCSAAFNFWRTSIVFSIMAVPTCIPGHDI